MTVALGIVPCAGQASSGRGLPGFPSDLVSLAWSGGIQSTESPWKVVLQPYSGVWQERQEFIENREEARAYLPIALEQIGRELSLPRDVGCAVELEFVDNLGRSRPVDLETSVIRRGAEVKCLITAGVEKFMSHTKDGLRHRLKHEAAHCWVAALQKPGAAALESWVEEGFAVWVSGEGDDVVRRFVSNSLGRSKSGDPEKLVWSEDARVRRGEFSHAYSYLAMAHFVERWGKGIARSLIEDSDWRKVVVREGQGTPDDVLKGVREYALRELSRRSVGRGEYLAARQLSWEFKWTEARVALEEFVRNHPDSDFVHLALYESAMCALQLKEYGAASEYFNKATRAFPQSEIRGDISYNAYRAAYKAGDVEAAKRLGEQFVALYGYSRERASYTVRRELAELDARSPVPK